MLARKFRIQPRPRSTLTRSQLLDPDRGLNFTRQFDHRVDFLVGLLALLADVLECLVHGQLAIEVVIDQVLLDRETRLDRFFTGPVLSMGLSLNLRRAFTSQPRERSLPGSVSTVTHKDRLDAHASVPTQTDSFCALRLLQSSQVQVEILCDAYEQIDPRR